MDKSQEEHLKELETFVTEMQEIYSEMLKNSASLNSEETAAIFIDIEDLYLE
jgi:hypothetical protein